jgi:KipI family sensor histidine kinase inhibitor
MDESGKVPVEILIPSPSIRFVSDASLLVSWSGPPSIETNSWVLTLLRRLSRAPSVWQIENLHPAYSSLQIDFGPKAPTPAVRMEFVRNLCSQIVYGEMMDGELKQIPVRYDGEDLAEVAKCIGTTVEEVIRLHSESEYRVAFLGFAPGFPYLLGLREVLNVPRKALPRLKVPAGSVAIAGFQTGIYPVESPGGWQLLGRTPVELFAPGRDPTCWLKPGDRVRFKALSEPRAFQQKKAVLRDWPGDSLVEILAPGMFSTLQDFGRTGMAHLGISRGGAADPLALRIGNQILGNSSQAAAIEMTASGLKLRFLKDAWFCLAGADAPSTLDGRPLEVWSAVQAYRGQTLEVGALAKMRTYLCVRGGFGAEVVLASRSTFVNGGWGGFAGRELRAGDILSAENMIVGEPSYRSRSLFLRRLYNEDHGVLHVTRGPQWDWFSDAAKGTFLENQFEVSNDVNRLGLRLIGPNLEYAVNARASEMLSEGVAAGAIQVSPSGVPMILFCEQTTTGGYPKIVNICSNDVFRLGQLKPGDKLRFKEIEREEAWRTAREFEETLQSMGFVS